MRVLIVGGGAAGLCCAIRLRQLDPAVQVTVLERLEQPGKKLLATGNGRCNLTNMQAPHSRAVLDFFASLGLMTRQEDLGRVYPYSLRAATVQNLLLDACRAHGGVRFHQVSTDEVYGDLPLDRPDLLFTEESPLRPSSPYSASKAGADLLTLAYCRTYGLPVTVSRCSNNYGPYQFPEKLIPLMINNVKHHKQLPVYGDGMQIRDWLYVEDHCKAIDMVCNGGKVGEVYNVGGHNERPNIFIVKTIIEQLHDRLKDDGISEDLIKHVADRLGHDRRYGIDPTKIKNDLGWYPETPFEKGIVLTIDWYLDHEEWMEHITSGNYQKYYEEMYKNK